MDSSATERPLRGGRRVERRSELGVSFASLRGVFVVALRLVGSPKPGSTATALTSRLEDGGASSERGLRSFVFTLLPLSRVGLSRDARESRTSLAGGRVASTSTDASFLATGSSETPHMLGLLLRLGAPNCFVSESEGSLGSSLARAVDCCGGSGDETPKNCATASHELRNREGSGLDNSTACEITGSAYASSTWGGCSNTTAGF